MFLHWIKLVTTGFYWFRDLHSVPTGLNLVRLQIGSQHRWCYGDISLRDIANQYHALIGILNKRFENEEYLNNHTAHYSKCTLSRIITTNIFPESPFLKDFFFNESELVSDLVHNLYTQTRVSQRAARQKMLVPFPSETLRQEEKLPSIWAKALHIGWSASSPADVRFLALPEGVEALLIARQLSLQLAKFRPLLLWRLHAVIFAGTVQAPLGHFSPRLSTPTESRGNIGQAKSRFAKLGCFASPVPLRGDRTSGRWSLVQSRRWMPRNQRLSNPVS